MLQLGKIIENLLTMFKKQNRKKLIENSVILAIIGIVVIIAGSTFFGGSKPNNSTQKAATTGNSVSVRNVSLDDSTEVEKKIEAVLSQINGAGKVVVMITYASGKELVPVTNDKTTDNQTTEKDTSGGTRNAQQSDSESTVVYEEAQDGSKKAIISKEILPQVKGVVVVADGAGNAEVKDNLVNAVQVLVDIPIYKIKVFQRSK